MINVVLTDLYYLYYHAHNGDAATKILIRSSCKSVHFWGFLVMLQ
jgi:hypothetical protein